MTRRDKLRQALGYWASPAPLQKGWTDREKGIACAALQRQLRTPPRSPVQHRMSIYD